jgi:hypothetical protein
LQWAINSLRKLANVAEVDLGFYDRHHCMQAPVLQR